MTGSFDQFARGVMNGQRRGAGATMLRSVLRVAEPFYSGVMRVRNWMFDRGIRRVHRLPRPVISVGNITTGGTGKTPIVIRLATQLRDRHRLRPAILLRGYTVGASQMSDEQALLQRALAVPVIAGADRVAAAQHTLAAKQEVDLFILDDAFQHRRVARDFDLVLIDATNPFGLGHVLPRGLLREPLAGLQRASAVVITHADEVSSATLEQVRSTLRRHNSAAPIYHASHVHERFEVLGSGEAMPREALRGRRYFSFCGIGNPQSFQRQLSAVGGTQVGRRWFGDHHAYTAQDVASVQSEAAAAGAELLVTTAKDAVKLATLPERPGSLPTWQAMLDVRFLGEDEEKLMAQVVAAVSAAQGAT